MVHERGRFVAIVEGTDAPAALRASKLVSPLIMAFRRTDLFRALPAVGRENRQSEYYLNEVLPILHRQGRAVSVVPVDTGGTFGVNSGRAGRRRARRPRPDQRDAPGQRRHDRRPGRHLHRRRRPIGRDTVIHPMTFLEGETRIGAEASIGPSTRIADSRVGDRSEVTFAVVLDSTIGKDVRVGPFVRMRPGTVLEDGSKAGAFVDLKNVTVGKGSKVPHLSYVGDADHRHGRERRRRHGTVNFDGYEKHRTVIGDGASIGSDTMLIAPVTIGKDANTGAGSVITKDVPAGALAVERAEQRNVEGYRKRKDAEHRLPGAGRRAKKARGARWRSSRRSG